jgi:hypothetical protein
MQRIFHLGPAFVGFGWAEDYKWDWTSDIGDEHTDYVSVAVCRRPKHPALFRVTLGPLCVSFILDRYEASPPVPTAHQCFVAHDMRRGEGRSWRSCSRCHTMECPVCKAAPLLGQPAGHINFCGDRCTGCDACEGAAVRR